MMHNAPKGQIETRWFINIEKGVATVYLLIDRVLNEAINAADECISLREVWLKAEQHRIVPGMRHVVLTHSDGVEFLIRWQQSEKVGDGGTLGDPESIDIEATNYYHEAETPQWYIDEMKRAYNANKQRQDIEGLIGAFVVALVPGLVLGGLGIVAELLNDRHNAPQRPQDGPQAPHPDLLRDVIGPAVNSIYEALKPVEDEDHV